MPAPDKSLQANPSADHYPSSQTLDQLCGGLEQLADKLEERGDWPHEQLALCGQHGVLGWFVPEPWGGAGWSDAEIFRAYLDLAAACLTTTFVLTQRAGACRRIALSEDEQLKAHWLPQLATGDHTFVLEVWDGEATATDSMVLTVDNSPPKSPQFCGSSSRR